MTEQKAVTSHQREQFHGCFPRLLCTHNSTYRVCDECIAALSEVSDLRAQISTLTQENERLKAALAGLVGSSDRAELEAMEAAIRMMPIPADDAARTIDAIHALLALEAK